MLRLWSLPRPSLESWQSQLLMEWESSHALDNGKKLSVKLKLQLDEDGNAIYRLKPNLALWSVITPEGKGHIPCSYVNSPAGLISFSVGIRGKVASTHKMKKIKGLFMNGVGTGLKGAKQWAVSVYGPYSHTRFCMGRAQSTQWAELSTLLPEIVYALDKHFPKIYIFTNSWLWVNGLTKKFYLTRTSAKCGMRTGHEPTLWLCPLIIQHLAKQTAYHPLERKALSSAIQVLCSTDDTKEQVWICNGYLWDRTHHPRLANTIWTMPRRHSSTAGCRWLGLQPLLCCYMFSLPKFLSLPVNSTATGVCIIT